MCLDVITSDFGTYDALILIDSQIIKIPFYNQFMRIDSASVMSEILRIQYEIDLKKKYNSPMY